MLISHRFFSFSKTKCTERIRVKIKRYQADFLVCCRDIKCVQHILNSHAHLNRTTSKSIFGIIEYVHLHLQ
jgi:hypothetical protein